MIKSSDPAFQEVSTKVYQQGQQQILRFWDQLSEKQQKNLLEQIGLIDFDLIDRLTAQALNEQKKEEKISLQAPPVISLEERKNSDRQAENIGREAIRAGRVAAFLVAGGQGTRLGFDGPKGMYPVTPVKQKSLFQLHAEKLLAVGSQNDTMIPWYIMTSVTNHKATRTFLKENDYNQEEHPFRKVVSQDQWQGSKITLLDRIKYKIKKLLEK